MREKDRRTDRSVHKLNSNNPLTIINNVCSECGIGASKATYPNREKHSFEISTFHLWICDFCKEEKSITQTRDFFYPDFSLL